MKKMIKLIPSALIGFTMMIAVSSAQATEKEAKTFISDLADQAFQLLRNDSMSLDAREKKLRALLQDGFALKFIGRYVVSRYWKKMTKDQQEEYQKLFAEWTLRTYSSRLGGYKDQKFEVIGTVDSGKKDIFVKTRINQPGGGKAIQGNWRVRKVKGKYQIVDISVEGISMLLTQKREFSSLLKRDGIQGMLQMLRTRNSKFSATTS